MDMEDQITHLKMVAGPDLVKHPRLMDELFTRLAIAGQSTATKCENCEHAFLTR